MITPARKTARFADTQRPKMREPGTARVLGLLEVWAGEHRPDPGGVRQLTLLPRLVRLDTLAGTTYWVWPPARSTRGYSTQARASPGGWPRPANWKALEAVTCAESLRRGPPLAHPGANARGPAPDRAVPARLPGGTRWRCSNAHPPQLAGELGPALGPALRQRQEKVFAPDRSLRSGEDVRPAGSDDPGKGASCRVTGGGVGIVAARASEPEQCRGPDLRS